MHGKLLKYVKLVIFKNRWGEKDHITNVKRKTAIGKSKKKYPPNKNKKQRGEVSATQESLSHLEKQR